MNSAIEFDDATLNKLVKNAKNKGVTPEVWLSDIIEQEYKLSALPRLTREERKSLNEYSRSLDRRFADIMNKKRDKIMGRKQNDS